MNLHRSVYGPVAWAFLSGCLLFVGCSRAPQTPVEQAENYFLEGQFTQAVDVIEAELGRTTDPQLQSRLWSLKGQCFWNQSVSDAGDSAGVANDPMIGKAIEATTKSIEIMDNAVARHIRSLAYEKLGDQAKAKEDNLVWRKLEPEVYLGTPQLNTSVPPRSTATVGEDNTGSPATPDPEWNARSGNEESPESLGPSPGTEDPAESPQQKPSASDQSPRNRKSILSKSSDPKNTSGSSKSPNDLAGTDEPSGETTDEEETAPETPKAESGKSSASENRRLPNRLPTSTYQVPDAGGAGSFMPQFDAPAPTGLTGPSSSFGNPSSLGNPSSYGPPPTGIVGPSAPGTSGPANDSSAGYGPPPTGIVGPSTYRPGAGAFGTGNYSIGAPSPTSPMVPYTGALPPEQRPTDPRAANFFNQGPSYSPLRPSPLTNPTLLQPRLPAPAYTRNPYLNSATQTNGTLPASRPAPSRVPSPLPNSR